jgi:hypothetical protein
MKAARRNLSHSDAINETVHLTDRYRKLWNGQMASSPVVLVQVLGRLIQKKIPFVLTGAHGISGWTGRPRGTQDIDILVKGGRNHARAVKAIRALYPKLEVHDVTGITGFFIPGKKQSLIDVVYPHRADIAETLATAIWTKDEESGLRYRIPTLECALANKYGAMVTPPRDITKRQQDAVDFAWIVKHSDDEGRKPIDLEKLGGLGEKVWPGGGGAEILRLVEQVKAGRAIHVDDMGALRQGGNL